MDNRYLLDRRNPSARILIRKYTREIVKPIKEEKIKLKDGIKAINGQYILFVITMFIYLLGFAVKQAGVFYYYNYYIGLTPVTDNTNPRKEYTADGRSVSVIEIY